MWLITELGFFSIVQKADDRDKGLLTVRSRVRADLEALAATHLPLVGAIEESSHTDYRFRAKARQADVAAAMARLAAGIGYSNFKCRVAHVQGHARADLYHDVWEVLYKLQTKVAFTKPKANEPSPVKASVDSASDASPAKTPRLKQAAGGVLVNDEGQVLLREPANHFDGYHWTFAKGKVDPDETPEDAALRETLEETGYTAEIISPISGSFAGGTSVTTYFLMRPIGDQASFHWETSATCWVSFDEAKSLIGQTTNVTGRQRDLAVLDAARDALRKLSSGR